MATTEGESRKKLLERILPPWVAPWLTTPQLVIKILQFSCAVVTLALIASWDPGEFGISDLLERIKEGAPLMAVMIVAGISQVYVLAMLVIGLIGISIPPQIRTIAAGFFLLLWVITLPIMSSKITSFKSYFTLRIIQVNFTQVEVSVVIGFLAMFCFMADVLTGLIALNKYQHKRFSKTDMITKAT